MRISLNARHNSGIEVFKAPKGKMYNILGVYCTVLTAGNNNIMVLTRAMEDPADQAIDAGGELSDLLFAIATDVVHSVNAKYKGEKTKFISVGPGNTATLTNTLLVIEYELVKASRMDIIWEWLGKKR